MNASRILGLETSAERRIRAERVADRRVEPCPGAPYRKRVRHRRDASLWIAQEPRLSKVDARFVDRRRAVSELVGREVGGTQHVVVHAVARFHHGPLVHRPGTRYARHQHRLSAPATTGWPCVAGVNRSAVHVEGARCKLRYRIPRIGQLRQLRDRDVGVRIEAR